MWILARTELVRSLNVREILCKKLLKYVLKRGTIYVPLKDFVFYIYKWWVCFWIILCTAVTMTGGGGVLVCVELGSAELMEIYKHYVVIVYYNGSTTPDTSFVSVQFVLVR